MDHPAARRPAYFHDQRLPSTERHPSVQAASAPKLERAMRASQPADLSFGLPRSGENQAGLLKKHGAVLRRRNALKRDTPPASKADRRGTRLTVCRPSPAGVSAAHGFLLEVFSARSRIQLTGGDAQVVSADRDGNRATRSDRGAWPGNLSQPFRHLASGAQSESSGPPTTPQGTVHCTVVVSLADGWGSLAQMRPLTALCRRLQARCPRRRRCPHNGA